MMRIKRRAFSLAAAVGLAASLSVGASALEYHIPGVEGAEFYPATSYDYIYDAQYNYGMTNSVDFQWPELPYGISDGTSLGCMKKTRFPMTPASSAGTSGTSELPSLSLDTAPSIAPVLPACTSVTGMERKDGSIGTLEIPSLGISMKVWEGETSQSMAKGLGHYSSTSGWDGNVGVCGHNRGAKYVIGSIKDLVVGDTITYTTVYGTRTYTVESVNVILDTDWSYLQETADNRITITTCLANKPEYRVCVQAVEAK